MSYIQVSHRWSVWWNSLLYTTITVNIVAPSAALCIAVCNVCAAYSLLRLMGRTKWIDYIYIYMCVCVCVCVVELEAGGYLNKWMTLEYITSLPATVSTSTVRRWSEVQPNFVRSIMHCQSIIQLINIYIYIYIYSINSIDARPVFRFRIRVYVYVHMYIYYGA